MEAELERLRAENTQLKSKAKGGIVLKATPKGAVSLYGITRSPITLNKGQWLRILASEAEVEAFISENDSKLATKESMRLISLMYASSATVHFSEQDLAALLNKARENNLRLGITGLLLYKNGEFMQALEGEENVVDQLYCRIEQDSRHTGAVLLREIIEKPRFPDWSMGFTNLQSTNTRQLPGYSPFMDEPLAWPGFQEDPSKVQKLFAVFSGHQADRLAQLEHLRAENTQLKNKDKGGIVLKLGEKGTICMYGIGQFAVTLNKEQWLRILASASEIRAFIGENDSKLSTKE